MTMRGIRYRVRNAGMVIGFWIVAVGWEGKAGAAEGGASAFRVLAGVRRCFERVRGGDPNDHCEQAFQRWIYQRVYCSQSTFGGDFVLAPVGTVRRYVRRHFDGRPDVLVAEWVAKLRVEEGPAVRMWITRSGEGQDALLSLLVDGRSGFAFFDSAEIGNRVVTCQSLEPYLAGPGTASWIGSGCWLTDGVSAAVYPHAHRSALADLFLPGSLVGWRYQTSPATEPVRVKAGPFSDVWVRRSVPHDGRSVKAAFEDMFARGAGRIRSAGYEDGRPLWVEELAGLSYPSRPRDPQRFCEGVQ